MGSTFLKLTNDVLVSLNEVQLDDMNFDDVLGIHAAAKDAVNFAIQKINAVKFEWPFNSTDGSQTLVPGQTFYDFPSDYKIAEWDSFYIENNGTLSNRTLTLNYIHRNQWYKRLRSDDLDAGSDGLDIPRYVFKGTGTNFGVTRSPNAAYTLKYKYFKIPVDLSDSTDTCDVPSNFDYVIHSGAMWYMYLWRENENRAAIAENDFEKVRNQMALVLLDNHQFVTDTVINRGGNIPVSFGFADTD